MNEHGAANSTPRTNTRRWVVALVVSLTVFLLGISWIGRETTRQLGLIAAGVEQIISGVRVTDDVAVAGSSVLINGDTVARITRVVRSSTGSDALPTISLFAVGGDIDPTALGGPSKGVAWVDSMPVSSRRVIVTIVGVVPPGAKRYGQVWLIGHERALPLYGP